MSETSTLPQSTATSSRSTIAYVHYNTPESGAVPITEIELRGRQQAIRFAHPAEAAIARLLDFYGVRWQYEPTTFALHTGESGRPVQSFTPDFYLPEQDLYIEMTTMRQSLVTRKNRKFRLLRELYPELNVKLLYRKDVEHILDRFSRPLETGGGALRQIVSAEQIERRAAEIADELVDGSGRQLCLLALGQGAVRTRDLIRRRVAAQGGEATTGLITVQGFGQDAPLCDVSLEPEAPQLPAGRDIVVVADIVGTGLTALAALRRLRSLGAGNVRLVTLLDRRSSRLVDLPIELAGFAATSLWHVGAGLGGDARYRDLPDIHTLAALPPA